MDLLKESIKCDQDVILKKLPSSLTKIILQPKTLGIHLRLGDRKHESTLSNFKNNFLRINLKQYDRIVFFSDDPNINIAIKDFINTEIIFINDFGLNDYEEFLICTVISNFFVSNSTFSVTARLLALNNVLTFYSGADFKKFGEDIPNLLDRSLNSINLDHNTI